jgi:hypothetical protein
LVVLLTARPRGLLLRAGPGILHKAIGGISA